MERNAMLVTTLTRAVADSALAVPVRAAEFESARQQRKAATQRMQPREVREENKTLSESHGVPCNFNGAPWA